MSKSTIIVGDCLEVLRGMDAGGVQCVVTSPPYWGLRDYGAAGQLGLEKTPGEFVAKLVEVFREVRRVMRDDGTLWLNLGDSYANFGGAGRQGKNGQRANRTFTAEGCPTRKGDGLKPKDLCGIPWRVALALQADGWYLRSDIIWAKSNTMPENVTDRPTQAHDYIFLLTKRPRYFYDMTATREPCASGPNTTETPKGDYNERRKPGDKTDGEWTRTRPPSRPPGYHGHPLGRNLRDVWHIPKQPYAKAHFATYPEKLVVPCIKAGTSEKGCCPECGAGWVRVVEDYKVRGWRSGCTCNAGEPMPCLVCDPFAGAGTTGVVAKQLGRSFVGVELNPEYAEMARRRIANPRPEPEIPDVAGQQRIIFPGAMNGNERNESV